MKKRSDDPRCRVLNPVSVAAVLLLLVTSLIASAALADPCVLPDNGTGTVDLPPEGCDYLSPDEVHEIIDGLPPGTTIELDPIHDRFFTTSRTPGGTLGGEIEVFESTLDLTISGTGELAGFNRHLEVPINCEVHTGPYAEVFHRAGRTDRQADVRRELERIGRSGELIRQTGMQFNAGHALTYYNVQPIAALPQVRELHIGHSIVSRAVFTGLRAAVGEMKRLMREAAAAVAVADPSSVGGMA